VTDDEPSVPSAAFTGSPAQVWPTEREPQAAGTLFWSGYQVEVGE
jgi:hypothetical protein